MVILFKLVDSLSFSSWKYERLLMKYLVIFHPDSHNKLYGHSTDFLISVNI